MGFEITATYAKRVYLNYTHIHAPLHKEARWNRRLCAGVAHIFCQSAHWVSLYCLHISVWTEEERRVHKERKIALRRTGAEKSLHLRAWECRFVFCSSAVVECIFRPAMRRLFWCTWIISENCSVELGNFFTRVRALFCILLHLSAICSVQKRKKHYLLHLINLSGA